MSAHRQARRELRVITPSVKRSSERGRTPPDNPALLPGEIIALQAIGRQLARAMLSERRERAKVAAPKSSGER